MSAYRSDFMQTMAARGYIHQCSDADGLDARAAREPITAYIGFDCTAPSLHVGHLISIMMLRRLQQAGHRPIVLIGGGTTRVGDPSGRDESRQLLTDEVISENIAGIAKVFAKFLTFGDGPADALMVNNRDWLDDLEYIGFLRDYGRHFSINRMLTFDSVKLRLDREQPLSFLEFNYMVLQAYDFVELNRRHGCTLQMGGSDQWGNIVNGIELARRTGGAELFGLTTPLLTTSAGQKMGKTAQGAVWLDEAMLSAYDYWQFWRNTDDGDVARFMRLFTEIEEAEIARLDALEGQARNEAKKVLANEATAMVHGRAAAEAAAATARATFEAGGAGAGLPTTEKPKSLLESGYGILTASVDLGLAASTSEARRHVKGGALRINDQPVADPKATISLDDINADGVIKVSIGRKRHALLKPI